MSNPFKWISLLFLFDYSEEIVELQIQLDTGQGLETTLRQSLQEVKGWNMLIFSSKIL